MILQSDIRTFYELQPVLPVGQWWQVCVLALVILGILLWSIFLYRRDNVDLNPASSFLLSALRLITIATVVLFVANPGQRSETRISKPSRLAVLMDNSLSMGLMDPVADGSAERSVRYQQLVELLDEAKVQDFRKDHQVSIYRFGDADQPELIEELPKLSNSVNESSSDLSVDDRSELFVSSKVIWAAIAICAVALLFAIIGMIRHSPSTPSLDDESNSRFGTWWFSFGVLLFLAGLWGMAIGDLWTPKASVAQSLGIYAGRSHKQIDRRRCWPCQ